MVRSTADFTPSSALMTDNSREEYVFPSRASTHGEQRGLWLTHSARVLHATRSTRSRITKIRDQCLACMTASETRRNACLIDTENLHYTPSLGMGSDLLLGRLCKRIQKMR